MQLVLAPGLLCDAEVWRAQRAALAEFGDIFIPQYAQLNSLPAMAERLLGSVKGSFAIAGHSMGGRVALEVFRQAPQRVLGLALLDTAYQPLAGGEVGEKERAGRLKLLNIAQTQGMHAMASEWVLPMVHPSRHEDRALLDTIVRMMERASPEIYAAQINALLCRPDATKLLPQIACPVLTLCGAEDLWSPAARHREMAQMVQHGEFVVIPDCGHMSPMERPGAVNVALRDWLKRIAARPA
ncbi:MAG: alpha/beta hydrolase [Steroidobacteraceae bacterium]